MARKREYLYKVGDVVNGLEVLEQTRVGRDKGYKLQCTKCGLGNGTPYFNMYHEYIEDGKYFNSESHLMQGIGCPCCSGKAVIPTVNSAYALRPDLVKYFKDEEDSKKYSVSSSKKLNMICPNCGREKKLRIDILLRQGFGCVNCSDGVSYPERVVSNVLRQLKIDYQPHYRPIWTNKEYDFYFRLNEEEYIIEAHGKQHYEGGFERANGRNLKEEQENDIEKQQSAIEKGINYIVIDCRNSNLEWIKNSILNSELNKIVDLTIIDWEKIGKDSEKSLVKEVCEYWNGNYEKIGTLEVAEHFNVARDTIIRYLKKGSQIGLLKVPYDGKTEGAKTMRLKQSGENNPSSKPIFIYSTDKKLVYRGETQKEGRLWLYENGYVDSLETHVILRNRDTNKPCVFVKRPKEVLYFYTYDITIK